MADRVYQRIFSLAVLIAVVLVIGTCGFALVEGWDLFDGLYMTLITISTVGYGEIHELSRPGRSFAGLLIILSMVSMVYWTAGITSILVSGDLSGTFLKKKDLKMIAGYSNHVVVCGGGVMARTVIAGLLRQSIQVVAIMNDDEQIGLARRLYPDLAIISADPKSELALADANVLRADYLIAAMESDIDNLLITITGKGLGTGIQIFSCALTTELATRMTKVGASQVICPLVLCGEHVTSLIQQSEPATWITA